MLPPVAFAAIWVGTELRRITNGLGTVLPLDTTVQAALSSSVDDRSTLLLDGASG
ncbi:MAG TPA: hypothetical protein VG247_26860 [Pseudonocardiaceae bacterium]|jgi:hypothetical protein|nr:hypothetical protein [Pseudonocardiaceae bacterium]